MTAREASIHVCPLSRLPETLRISGAASVVTLLAEDQRGAMPPLPGCRHLALDLSDISAPRDGYACPDRSHMDKLLAFARRWDRRRPLLIHCYAGVSRSTAAAFAVACALQPGKNEREIADDLRAASPSATPNPRIVALADAALDRSGRMVEAARAIGRGRDCFESEVFRLRLPGLERQIPAYQA